MGLITRDEVFEYWPKRLDDTELETRLNDLYRAANRDRLSISQAYDGARAEDINWGLIKCLKKHFRTERFVILRYDSWIMSRLIESGVHPESLGQDYGEFWTESLRTKADRSANDWRFKDNYFHKKKVTTARNFATNAFCKRCKEKKNKLLVLNRKQEDTQELEDNLNEALNDCCGSKFPSPHGIIAAFSESKIWIGFDHYDPIQLATVISAGEPAIPIPCFSWSRGSGFSNPGNDCLAPWAKFTSFSTPNYDPKQAIELFRELWVRCSSRFMGKSSLHHHL
jgi:hypothetical protein